MSYWQGVGRAPNYSRSVEAASAVVNEAKQKLQETLKAEYPHGAHVRVIHHRGHFTGSVVGWDYDGSRVWVKNDRTEKTGKWWAAHVELA